MRARNLFWMGLLLAGALAGACGDDAKGPSQECVHQQRCQYNTATQAYDLNCVVVDASPACDGGVGDAGADR